MSKIITIFGSARSDGHTKKAVDLALSGVQHKFIDLSELKINQFDYLKDNSNDDFIPLMQEILEHDKLILATPIYWYSASTIMKIFIDRWSNILGGKYKYIGKKLKEKELFVISSNGVSSSRCFEEMFEQTCDYLDMKYMGCYNYHSGKDEVQILQSQQELLEFRKKIVE
jgi:multimeric flavodoxin WrbA